MAYEFKGYHWVELAECWGIKAEKQPLDANGDFKVPEKIEVTKRINGMKIVFEVDDEEEVLAEKIKRYIFNNLTPEGFKDKSIREDMERFLKALIEESKKWDFSYPAYEGILKIEHDVSFAKWFCRNLEAMWT